MAKTKEIEIGYGRTVNTGNYNNERFDLLARVELEPGEDENDVVGSYFEWLKSHVNSLADGALTKVHG